MGEGKAGVVFWILVFVVAAVVGKEWIPAKISDMQLKDHIDELAKLYPRQTGDWFVEQIVRRAKDLDIPLDRKKVQVEKTQQRVRVRFEYTQELDLILTTWPLTFKCDVERDIFLI
jgi:hypothetical protein